MPTRRSDNVAYTTASQLGAFTVRCAELCGLWHGAMYNFGRVLTKSQFFVWAQSTQRQNAANTKLLPPFSYTYVPDANGADGGLLSRQCRPVQQGGDSTAPRVRASRKDD